MKWVLTSLWLWNPRLHLLLKGSCLSAREAAVKPSTRYQLDLVGDQLRLLFQQLCFTCSVLLGGGWLSSCSLLHPPPPASGSSPAVFLSFSACTEQGVGAGPGLVLRFCELCGFSAFLSFACFPKYHFLLPVKTFTVWLIACFRAHSFRLSLAPYTPSLLNLIAFELK